MVRQIVAHVSVLVLGLCWAASAWSANWLNTVAEVDGERGIRHVFIQLGVAVDLTSEFNAIGDGEYVATASLDPDFEDSDWQFTELKIDEQDQLIETVSIQGSKAKGIAVKLQLDSDYVINTKPQLNRSRIEFSVIPRNVLRDIVNENKGDTDSYAVEIQTTRLLSSQSLPLELIDNNVIYSKPSQLANKRIGFFATETAARVTLQKLRGQFPKAAIVGVNQAEQDNAQLFKLFPGKTNAPARHRPKVAISTEAATPSTIDKIEPEIDTGVAFVSELDRSLLDEAQDAYLARDWNLAIRLYTEAADTPALRMEALEKLGVTRERNRQHDLARQIYEQFLVDYPDAIESRRVKQRLQSLAGAEDIPETLRTAKRQRNSGWSNNAFLSQFYRRQTFEIDGQDEQVPIDAVFTDANLLVRKRSDAGFHEGKLSVGHIWDLSDSSRSQKSFRLQKASWESYFERYRTGITLGRQSRYQSGVLGRFDGVTVSHKQSEGLQWNAVGGVITQSAYDSLNAEQPFVGVSADIKLLDNQLEISPFFIQQEYDGILDRQAIGSHLSWLGKTMVMTAHLDYDLNHAALNNAYFSASFNLNNNWRLHGALNHRRNPYLTTSNALIGQQYDDLSELERDLIGLTLGDLAEDRTATLDTARVGIDGALTDTWRLTLDASASDYSDTESSAGVTAVPEHRDYYFNAQLRASNLFGHNTYGAVQLRMQSSDTSDTTTLILNNRFRINRNWLIYPRLVASQRVYDVDSLEQLRVRPALRVDYAGFSAVRLEAEIGYDWYSRETFTGDIDMTGLSVRLGYRVRF